MSTQIVNAKGERTACVDLLVKPGGFLLTGFPAYALTRLPAV
jgi:hypothetical protein